MKRQSTRNFSRRRAVRSRGSGLVNSLINKLPVELHVPGYRFCGPGTRLSKRLARGDRGINPLDEACKAHDISYAASNNIEERHRADKILGEKAWERFKAKDSSFGEKTAALTISGIMKGKTKLGMGARSKRRSKRIRKRKISGRAISFRNAMKIARKRIGGGVISDLLNTAKIALTSLKKKNITPPKQRVIPIPKTGGILPLIPIFAALGALGSLAGGAAGVAKAVNDSKAASKTLQETERHNRAMETASVGKGLYLKPYKKGLGLYLTPYQKNFQ